MISMGDGTTKQIKDVKPGEIIISAKTGTTTVWFLDQVTTDGRRLLNIDGCAFVTEDHCFYGTAGERLSANVPLSVSQRHWTAISEKTGMIFEDAPADTMVYDLISSDHTLIANGIPFYDDMPEIERYPLFSIICALIVKKNKKERVEKKDIDMVAYDLYEENIAGAIEEITGGDTETMFKENMEWFLGIDETSLHLCSSIWKHRFLETIKEIGEIEK